MSYRSPPRRAAALTLVAALLIVAPFGRSAHATTVTNTNGQTYQDSTSGSGVQTNSYGDFSGGFQTSVSLNSTSSGALAGSLWSETDVAIGNLTMDLGSGELDATYDSSGTLTMAYSLSVLGSEVFSFTKATSTYFMEECLDDDSVNATDNSTEDITTDNNLSSATQITASLDGFDIGVSLVPSGCVGYHVTSSESVNSGQETLKVSGISTGSVGAEATLSASLFGVYTASLVCTTELIDESVTTDLDMQAGSPSYDLTYAYDTTGSASADSGKLYVELDFLGIKQYGDTVWSWSGTSLYDGVLLTDSVPQISNQTINASLGYATQASYSWSDSNGLPDQSTFIWYQSPDANDANQTQVATSSNGYSSTNNTWNIMPLSNAIANGDSTSGGYSRYCVTPSNGIRAGAQVCSSWLSLGKLARTFQDSNYGGTNYNFAYQAAGIADGTCFNFPSSFNDSMSSFEIYAPSNTAAAFDFYNYDNCSNELMPGTIASGGSSLDSSLGSSHNDATNSVRIAAPDTVSASALSVGISGNTATGSYTYGGAGFSQSGTTYQWNRASNDSGTSGYTSNIGSSQTYTLQSADNEQYLQFCATPRDEFSTAGAEACSGWQPVNHLLELWQNSDYGGTNINIAYEYSSNGNCFNLTDYNFNDELSSLKFNGTSTNASTLWIFQNTDCGGSSATHTEQTNGVELTSSMSSTYGSTWNDYVSSFKITWD